MYPLTESQRGEIIGLYKNKQSIPKITRMLKVHRTTVSRTIEKYLNREYLATLSRSGRPKLLTNRSQKILKTIVKNNNKKSAEEIKKILLKKLILKFPQKLLREICTKCSFFLVYQLANLS